MKHLRSVYLIILIIFYQTTLRAQNEASKWYFGNQAGLDFMTNPPTVIQGSLSSNYSSGSMATAAGNLLFYANTGGIRNQIHQILSGSNVPAQISNPSGNNALIIKQPGNSNIYYIFANYWGGGIYYSTIDMNLAAGLGSLTVPSTSLIIPNSGFGYSGYTPRLTATRHCNGTDVWVIVRTFQVFNNAGSITTTQNFSSFLVTASGVNSTPTITTAQTDDPGMLMGDMKASPNGTKIGLSYCYYLSNQTLSNNYLFELWDFDASTGIVSNSLTLGSNNWINNLSSRSYGCEFSPDGSKFYGSIPNAGNIYNGGTILQWNMCAGTPTAIIASEYTVASGISSNLPFGMQLATNGSIYISRYNSTYVDVISNPNSSGAACSYSPQAQSLGGRICYYGLPNFMTNYLLPSNPFSYTIMNNSCFTTSFTAPGTSTFACAAMGYSVNGFLWNFGDPGSGAANTSSLANPVHSYPAPGTYTASLTFLKACGPVTITQTVLIEGATLSVSSTSINCANLGSATVSAQGGIGPYTFTWTPVAQSSSIATGLIPGNYTIQVLDVGNNCAYSSTVNFAPLVPLTGTVNNTPSIACNGVGTGTAEIVLAGGSGNYSYFWNNGLTIQNTASVINLASASHTVTVVDALTSCSVTQNFFISQPPAPGLLLSSTTPTVCAGGSVTLTAINSGGTPPYTYSWTNGPATSTRTVSEALSGNYTYSLTSTDANSCNTSSSISIDFIVNPTITVTNVSICPLQTGSLTGIGAASYTWLPSGTTGSLFSDNPITTTVYTVTGETLGCSSSAVTVSIVLNPAPSLTLSSNSPVCNGEALSFSSTSGSAYLWQGPLSFTSPLAAFTIDPASVANSGVYSITLTALNSCTSSASVNLTVHPTPTLSATGSTVCAGTTLSLTGNALAGSGFFWNGPMSYTAGLQNPLLSNSDVAMSGNYTLTVTSAQGCSNTAIINALVVPPPALNIALSSSSMCAQALSGSPNTITLTSSGANTYTLSTPSHIYNPNPAGPASLLSLSPPYQQNGPATATLIGSNGVCSVSLTADFTVVPNPAISVSNPTPVICAGQSFTYTSNGANSYTWSGSNPGTYVYTTGDVAVVNPSVNSVFSVVGASLGCLSSLQNSTITVNPLPVIAAQNANACLGLSAQLVATGNATSYSWSPSAYLSAVVGASVSSTPPTDQTYLLTGALNGCTVSVPVSVEVFALPSPSIQTSSNQLCLYEKVNFAGSGGNSYHWTGPGNVTLNGQQVSFTAMNLNQSGAFTLTVTDDRGCKNSTTTDVLIHNLPTASLSGKREGCAPFCAALTIGTSTSVNYSWTVNQQQITGPQLRYCFQFPGTYSVYATLKDSLNTCSNTIIYVLQVFPKPTADFDFSPKNPVEGFDEVLFTNTSPGEIFSNRWFFVHNGAYTSDSEHSSYLFASAGLYPVALVVTNAQGCKDTIVKAIRVEPDLNIYVPSAFTPNEDGKNEVFKPVGRNLTDYQLFVFDRWGELVFESTSPENGWDGFFKGQPAKSDVYVWQIHLRVQNGKAKQLNGYVTLYR